MLQIYNTLTRKKEIFKPKNSENVKIYYCGPTVYNYAQIGNFRTYIFEDIIIRTLQFLGYKTNTVMNLTDVDDKTIRESQKAKMSLSDFTKKYADIFLTDLEKLGIKKADNIVPVTSLIDEMVSMINVLLKKGFAYISEDGSIYFTIAKSQNYGQLAHLDFSGMKQSVRIDNDEYEKELASDFVLWKAWKESDGENYWEKEFIFGEEKKVLKGRPGWHIECSACNLKYFGPEIDLHMGGIDLIFPHHQNEIAQSEAVTGKKFSRYWVHSGHLMVDGKKMSKSLENFYTLNDIEEKYKNTRKEMLFRALRLLFINGKYRESIDFSFAKLEANINTVEKIDELVKRLAMAEKNNKKKGVRRDFSQELQYFIADYIESLEDDINTPEALSIFFNFISFANKELDTKNISSDEVKSIIDFLKTFNQILGIVDFSFLEENTIPKEIEEKFEARNTAKKEKNFSLADSLRDELLTLGYKIVDSREGTRLEKL
ncbi:cysteine--tRNA ligase [Candidatus Gracilibacteria bacterium]|nr:cysteine--tRNA ligase [Candidatus Gracilibacteria bacterium]NUJ99457.1 cysteine--tRNA ligase [Candidatus Gracilibacteria bacterium]